MNFHGPRDNDIPLTLYAILDIPQCSTSLEIKQAYHRALRQNHPDKRRYPIDTTKLTQNILNLSATNGDAIEEREIHVLKHAYDILSDPSARASYDASLSSEKQRKVGPRPAEVVSLQDFSEEGEEDSVRWTHPCRCGGLFEITEEDMDKGQHLIGCWSCSEAIWVGYEAVQEGG